MKNYCVILFLKICLWWINEGGDGWEGEHIYCAKKLYFGGWSILQASTNQLPIRYSLSYYVLIAIIDIRFITYIYRYSRSRVMYDRVQNRKYYLMINNILHIKWGITRARKFKLLFSFFTLVRASEMFLFSFEFPVLEV